LINPLKNINPILASGIKEIYILDIQSKIANLVKIKIGERFYRIFNKAGNYNYSVQEIKSFNYSGKISNIKDILSEYIAGKKEEIYLVTGINEYKLYNLQVPLEVEDIDLWLLENSEKYYPSKQNRNNFISGYEITREDENYRYGYIAVTRADYISEIEKAVNIKSVNLICITPLTLTFIISPLNNTSNQLFLNFTDDRLSYIFQTEEGFLQGGEIFYKETYEKELNENCTELFNEIKILTHDLGSSKGKEINEVFVSCKNEIFNEVKTLIYEDIGIKEINNGEQFSLNVSYSICMKKLLANFEKLIDFRGNDVENKQKEKLEKNFVLRFTLGFGIIFLALLIILFFSKNYLLQRINFQDEILINKQTNSFGLDKLKKENARLTSNYKLINSLRNDKSAYDDLLLKLTTMINSRSRFTDIELKVANSSGLSVILKGLAYEQVDVATLLKNFENDNRFTNTNLLYSNKISSDNVNQEKGQTLIQFQISADYNED
jgi:hypothetical protein